MDVACLTPSDSFDYPQVFEDVWRGRGIDVEMDGYQPHHGELPNAVDAYDAVLVTGSPHHVYDRQDWVEDTERYVAQALDADVPVMGVCYGHQLLADVLGGTVEPMKEREMGYHEVSVTAEGSDSPVMAELPDTFTAFTSHLDHVSALPDDATVLTENEYGIQAFESTEFPAYGVQFHPEFDLGMATDLLNEKDGLAPAEEAAIDRTLTRDRAEAAVASRRVLDNFFTMVRG